MYIYTRTHVIGNGLETVLGDGGTIQVLKLGE